MGGSVYDHRGRCVVGGTTRRRTVQDASSQRVATARREPRRKFSIGGLPVGVVWFLYRIVIEG